MAGASAGIGKVREITVSTGLSLEINGIWYRPNASITIELNEGNTKINREKAFAKAYEEVNNAIEKQIKELSGE